MKKIEIIWREILEQSATTSHFQQKELARKYGMSTSTIFAAITPLKRLGALEVGKKGFRIINLEKILLFWATHRNLEKDIIYKTYVDLPIFEIEGLVDNESIYGGYTAARFLLGPAPSDYARIYLYSQDSQILIKRFPPKKDPPNLFILKSDPFLSRFGRTTPPSQTFVDLWNMKDWYAQDFIKALKEKFYGFL